MASDDLENDVGQRTAYTVLQLESEDPAPAYVQLERQVRVAVADGVLKPGDRLPSIRDVSRRLGVSTNTVARAYAELGREGVILARSGGGSEIAPRDTLNQPALARLRQERLRTLARQVAIRGLALGLEPAEIAEAVARELAAHGRPVPGLDPPPQMGPDEALLLSARNRFRGTVIGVRAGDILAEVTVRLADGVEAVVAITRVSLERMGLTIGSQVSVHVKASELTLGR